MVRKHALVLTLMALGLGIGGCSSSDSSTRSDEASVDGGPAPEVVSHLIRDALQAEGNLSYGAVRERLGSPERSRADTVANQYVLGQVDTVRTLEYPGVEAQIYDAADEGKTFLVRLSLLSSHYATPEGIRVGDSESRVIDVLGAPTRRSSSRGELIYEETGETPTSTVLRVRDGTVVRISWEFYVS